MPTVPYLSQPRVSPSGLPGARIGPNAPAEAFGGGVAATKPDFSVPANVAGNVAEQNAQDRQRIRTEATLEADQVAVTHAVSATTTNVNDILHGPDGLLNRKGKDAFTIDQEAYDKYGALVADVRSQLGNDRQRAVYDKHVLNQWDAIDSQVQPHIAAQRQAFDKEGTDAAITANKNAAIAAPENPIVVEQAIRDSQAVLAARLQRLGMPDDAIKNATDLAASDIHLDVIKSMLNSPTNPARDQMASAYFDAHKDALVGKDRLEAEKLTKQSAIEGDAVRMADKIVATSSNEQAAYDQAAKIDNTVVREKTETRIALLYNRKRAATVQDQQANFERGYQILRANGGDISAVPITIRNAMGAMHDENLASEAHRIQTVRDPGDPEQYTTLLNEAYFNPSQFATRDIPTVQGLNLQQTQRLMTIQRSVGRQDDAPLRDDLRRAESDVRFYKRQIDAAALSGDAEKRDQATQNLKDAVLEKIRAENALTAHHAGASSAPTPPAPPDAPLTAPSAAGGEHPATYNPPARPAPYPIVSGPPLGLAPITMQRPTASMMADVMKYGPEYADFLRLHGYDPSLAPLPTPPAPAAKPKPTTTKTTVNRDKTGRITDTTTTITKPE